MRERRGIHEKRRRLREKGRGRETERDKRQSLVCQAGGWEEEERERQSSESGSERRRDRRFRLSWMAQRGEETEKGRTARKNPTTQEQTGSLACGFGGICLCILLCMQSIYVHSIQMAFGTVGQKGASLYAESRGHGTRGQLVRVACIGGRCGWGKFEMHSLADSLVSPA